MTQVCCPGTQFNCASAWVCAWATAIEFASATDTELATDPAGIVTVTGLLQAASPYPSIEVVTGGSGVITNVTVNLFQFSHQWPSDVCIVLKGPDGTTCVLMAGCGNGGFSVSGIDIEIDDTGGVMPQNGQLVTATYAPTNYPPFADVPAPGPVSPYGSDLSVFNGKDPNGTWSLWVCDEETGNSGVIQGGWGIVLTTA